MKRAVSLPATDHEALISRLRETQARKREEQEAAEKQRQEEAEKKRQEQEAAEKQRQEEAEKATKRGHALGREWAFRHATDPDCLKRAAERHEHLAWYTPYPGAPSQSASAARHFGFHWGDVPDATHEDRGSSDFLEGFLDGIASVWAEVKDQLGPS